MAPSKKRTAMARKPIARRGAGDCACLLREQSDGVCELTVWQGTTIEAAPGAQKAAAGVRLLRPKLPVIKYKELTLDGLSAYMYLMVMLHWGPLLALFGAIYVAIIGVFALCFALCNEDLPVDDAKARGYFNLSVQTMATIGYGVLFPQQSCSNWVVVVESFVSMIVTSLMTGIAFVKFARPQTQIIFSESFTVAQRDDGHGLEMRFRVVNGTRRELITKGEILEVSFKLILMMIEETKTGEKKLCYYDLHLKTTSYITLRLEAEIVHEIEQDSPLFGMTHDDIANSDFVLILMMSGIDETLHDMVQKQYEYSFENMHWGAKFVPLLSWDRGTNHIELDFKHISATVPSQIPYGEDEDSPVNLEVRIDRGPDLKTGGNEDTDDVLEDSFENVAEDEHTSEGMLLRGSRLMPSPPYGGVDYSDLESLGIFREGQTPTDNSPPGDEDGGSDDEEDEEKQNGISTSTNSGSESGELHEVPPERHVRFDSRRSMSSFRLPRLGRRRLHEPHNDPHEAPMSLMRRRVRFKNHPMSRFSKGLYYRALETSWFRLFVYLSLVYFSSIAFIAALMHISSGKSVINNGDVQVPYAYERLFFFCAQTISTIGYGALAPNPHNDLVNFYVCLLAMAGVVVSTLVTGLAWAKFSIPNASTIRFSDHILLTAFHSHRAIMFRAANSRVYGAVIEGSFRVSVAILNQRLGHMESHELKLVRNVWPVVQLASTITHIIDEDSPLYDISTDELLSGRYFFVVLFSGLDPFIGENMFSRKTYHSCDILVGHHFVDNIKLTAEGAHIDLEAMNDTTLAPEIDLRESRLFTATNAGASGSSESSDAAPRSQSNEDSTRAAEDHDSQLEWWRRAEWDERDNLTPRAAQYVLM